MAGGPHGGRAGRPGILGAVCQLSGELGVHAARRVRAASEAFATVEGVRGLILAGGLGWGASWPLSDIDLIPIYGDLQAQAASEEIERRREAMLPRWTAKGWWTGLDTGKLAFRESEVRAAQ